MPCGPQLIEAVERCILHEGVTSPTDIALSIETSMGKFSSRSIRYAITALVKQGRIRRVNGAIFAVRREE